MAVLLRAQRSKVVSLLEMARTFWVPFWEDIGGAKRRRPIGGRSLPRGSTGRRGSPRSALWLRWRIGNTMLSIGTFALAANDGTNASIEEADGFNRVRHCYIGQINGRQRGELLPRSFGCAVKFTIRLPVKTANALEFQLNRVC